MEQGPSLPLQVVAHKLQVDVTSGKVMSALGSAGVRSILLKGPSIAQWLYDRPTERPYNDCDILVDPARSDSAAGLLSSIGLEKMPQTFRGGLDQYAEIWIHPRFDVAVDLHSYLPGVGADPADAFEVLFQGSSVVVVRDGSIPALGLPGRTLNLALHVAQHGRQLRKALEDLERGLERLPRELWGDAAALATRLQATDAMAAGLALVAGGKELAAELGLPTEHSREVALRAATPPSLSLDLEWLSRTPGWRAKVRYVWARLSPSPTFVRMIFGRPDARGLALARLYVTRIVSSARKVPSSFSAWLRVRRGR